MYTKTLSWGLIVSFLLGGWLANPETCASQETRNNPLEGGSWAFQFGIGENFTLSDFSGTVISLKRHHSARSAFRAGLSTHYSSYARETDDPGSDPPSERDEDRLIFELDLQYLRYSNTNGGLSPFWGVGPLIGFASHSDKYSSGSGVDSRQWSFGVLGSLGVEWFPVRFIGFHAEYGLSITYGTSRTETGDPSSPEIRTSDVWGFGGRGVLFGLSVYF
jgi:hypothetical protein